MSDEREDHDALSPDSDVGEDQLDPAVTEALLEQPFFLGDVLRAQVSEEIERRDGTWSAFSASVSRRIDDAARVETRMSLEDRAIASFKKSVDAELAEVESRFERSFKEGIERQIWRAAKEPPSIFERARALIRPILRGPARAQPSLPDRTGARSRPLLNPSWGRVGLATATAALLGLLVFHGLDRGQNDSLARMDDVSVNQVDFEGTVTVMPADNGMTVVWLAPDGAS